MGCRQDLEEVFNCRRRDYFHHRFGPANSIDQLCDVGHCQTYWWHRYWYAQHGCALVHFRDLAAGDSRLAASPRGVEYRHRHCCGVLDHIRYEIYGRRMGLATTFLASTGSRPCAWIRNLISSILVSPSNESISSSIKRIR